MVLVPVSQPKFVDRALEQPNAQSKEIAAKAIGLIRYDIWRKLGSY